MSATTHIMSPVHPSIHVGTAGRAHGAAATLPRKLAAEAVSDWNSYCLICAHWHFGGLDAWCSRCHSPIFRWVHDDDLHLMRSHSSLGAF
jgi:hypothetical protein